MLPDLGRLGPFLIRTYTLLVNMAVLAGLVMLGYRGKRRQDRPNAWVDAGLAGFVGGLVGGRLGHVAIHQEYFTQHTDEIYRVWLGGLDWHSALVGGLLLFLAFCAVRSVPWRSALDVLALWLPVAVVSVHAGCWLSRCGYGREVPTLAGYSPLLVMELPDIYGTFLPRLFSQGYGMAAGLLLFAVAWVLRRFVRREGVLFWVMLILLGGSMYGIGFTLGTPVPEVNMMRLDQLLDLGVAAMGIAGLILTLALPVRQMPGSGTGSQEEMPDEI